MQAGAYQNGCWVVGVAKAGDEDGVRQIGNSIIVAPSGEIVAACSTEGDELAIARCDLDLTLSYKNTTFNFAAAPPAAGVRADRGAQGRRSRRRRDAADHYAATQARFAPHSRKGC